MLDAPTRQYLKRGILQKRSCLAKEQVLDSSASEGMDTAL